MAPMVPPGAPLAQNPAAACPRRSPGSILVSVVAPDTEDTTEKAPDRRARRELSDPMRNAIAAVLILLALAGLVFTVRWAVTGENNTSSALPESVERLIPESGSEVLTQSSVGVDLAVGYDAYLIINGTEVRSEEEGLVKDMGTGLITYQPGADGMAELVPEKNCVIAMVWKQEEGQKYAEPVSWCFTAS
jgi:hypothetical protein